MLRGKAIVVVHAFGRIDAWTDNAGVTFYPQLEEGSFDDHRRVVETNLFRRQQAGALVNVGSVIGAVGQAFVPSYIAAPMQSPEKVLAVAR